MHYFNYKGKDFCCEEIKIAALAEKFGTPLYLYSQRTFVEHFQKIKTAFSAINPLICYSVKANSNLAILKKLVGKGAGLDIVSGGELYRAEKIKCSPKKIVYASVGKTTDEIRDAISYGILMFNVESLPELDRINNVARSLKKKVDVALRVNPDIEPKTHKYITTGKKETKFGMDIDIVKKIFLQREKYSQLSICGIHIHIGSQITQVDPFIKAIKKVKKMVKEIEGKGVSIKYFNIGGGLGIVYDKEKPKTAKVFADKVLPLLKGEKFKVILEPGRFIVGNAGALITKVIYVKKTPTKRFIIVDAAMNDLLRPSLYEAYHNILPAKKGRKSSGLVKPADIVGPICESGDFLGKNRKLDVREGDCIVVLGAGAYGFSMSSNYNSRGRAAEVLVNGNKADCIREREQYKDLVAKEKVI
jgi:diaminopimelate decarboxylase